MSRPSIRRIGVLSQNDTYGQSGLTGVTQALKGHGLSPVGLGTVERNTVDVGAAVKSILAANPEAIVLISTYKTCAAFIRAARAADFTGTFYNVSFVGTKALAEELGAQARGVIVSQVMPYPYSAATPISGEYLAAGKGAAGDRFEPNYSSIEGYVAARALVAGLRHGGGSPRRAWSRDSIRCTTLTWAASTSTFRPRSTPAPGWWSSRS